MAVDAVDDDRVVSAVRLLRSADLSTCGHRELYALLGELQRVRGFVASTEIGVARRLEVLNSTPPTTADDAPGGEAADAPLPAALTGCRWTCPARTVVGIGVLAVTSRGLMRGRGCARCCRCSKRL
jgi:hypothetical protein